MVKPLPVSELVSLKSWIVNNRIKTSGFGNIWGYVVDDLINPVIKGTDSHTAGIPLVSSAAKVTPVVPSLVRPGVVKRPRQNA